MVRRYLLPRADETAPWALCQLDECSGFAEHPGIFLGEDICSYTGCSQRIRVIGSEPNIVTCGYHLYKSNDEDG
jgi:hypothetical protein